MTKVSVIIPVYNVEEYIEQSVLSVLNQTLSDIEIILINDGSTDGSFNIIKKLSDQDNRIKIISTRNNGVSIARNIGISYAVGEYIYILDSDDILEYNALELCYNKCIINDLDFIFFDAIAFSEDNNSIKEYNFKRTNKYTDIVYRGVDLLELQLNTYGYSSPVWLNMIKRKYIDDNGLFFYPKIIHEDILYTFLLYLKAKRIGLFNSSFLNYRIRNNSIKTTIYRAKNVEGYLTAARVLKSYFRRPMLSRKEKIVLRRYINYIIEHILTNMSKTISDELVLTKDILIKEFLFILNWKLLIRFKFPYFYKKLKKCKNMLQ